jgi:hypothetical protein
MLTVNDVVCGLAQVVDVEPVVPPLDPLLLEDELLLELELELELVEPVTDAVGVTATPTPSSPFMPAPAWPGTGQRNSYVPVLLRTTVMLCDWPLLSSFVAFPTHEFAFELVAGVVQILKMWPTAPAFVTLNVSEPAGRFENFESLKASSVGLPAVTVITVTFAVACFAV